MEIEASGFADVVGGGTAVTSRLVEWNFVPAPNLFPQLVLSALVPAVGARWAERLILVGYVVLLSLAAVWAIRQTRPGAMPLCFFVLPLTFNLPFLWGFLNFSYSIAGFLFVAGLLARWEGRLDTRRMVMLASALVLVFFTHLVGYLQAGLLATCILGAGWILGGKRLASFSRAAVALAPGAILTLVFIILTRSKQEPVLFDPVGTLKKLTHLVSLSGGVVAYDRLEVLPCVATALALWILVLIGAVRSRLGWITRPVPLGLAAFVFLSSAVAVLAPEGLQTGGTLGSIRYMLFPVLGALLWLAYQPLPRRAVSVGATVAGVSALALAIVRFDEFRAIETAVHDLRSLESCVLPGSTVVQGNVRIVRFGSLGRPDPLTAEVGRLVAACDAFDLGNIDFAVPFGLLRFRKETNPYIHLVPPGEGFFRTESAPPPLDLEGFERRTGISVDYVVLFGRAMPVGAVEREPWPPRSAEVRAAEWARFQSALNERYTLVKVSPVGLWELWGRHVPPPGKSLSSCTE